MFVFRANEKYIAKYREKNVNNLNHFVKQKHMKSAIQWVTQLRDYSIKKK
jgi:hypothetical protein